MSGAAQRLGELFVCEHLDESGGCFRCLAPAPGRCEMHKHTHSLRSTQYPENRIRNTTNFPLRT